MTIIPSHPAKFSDAVLDVIADLIEPDWLILDPFCGIGRIHELSDNVIGIEIEPEWAAAHPHTVCWDSLRARTLFSDASFDAIITSCCYGNRMADHHDARERCKNCRASGRVADLPCPKCNGSGVRTYKRITYRHFLGRPLHPNNSGQMQWGDVYREFHQRVWAEVTPLVRPDGLFILNVSDHIRKREVVPVTRFHTDVLQGYGWQLRRSHAVRTPRMGFGANRDARVEFEWVNVFSHS